jgi:ADP-ribosyl-[dinitrogen reductase] hydrolase
MPTTQMRYQGALLGLAAGDALGTTVEFKPPDSFTPMTEMIGGGPFRLKRGEWTDDTSMALCLASSLIECRVFDAKDQMERYTRWRHEGYLSSNGSCFDIGITISEALNRFALTGNPIAGSRDPQSAGNGSLMRLAPVPMFFASNPERAIQMSAESSRTTHGTRTCLDACRYFGGLLVGALMGVTKPELLERRYTPTGDQWNLDPLCPEIDEIASGSFKDKNPPDIIGNGYVVRSLEAALWAFNKSSTFEEGCLLAVNLGDDADTTGAIYGQLAGAFYGVEHIPEQWLNCLAFKAMIQQFADDLSSISSIG